MIVERPSDRTYACFFCCRQNASLSGFCTGCGKPIDIGSSLVKKTLRGYRLFEHVGRGYYGATFRAENRIGKSFALKIIPTALYQRRGKDFQQEIAKYRQLGNHPNIAELFDAGKATLTCSASSLSVYYVVAEWIDGQTLTQFIARNEFTVGEMYTAILDIAAGVSRFEIENLWHNDLNGDNILIKRLTEEERAVRLTESEYTCKIVDIGSAVFRQAGQHRIPDDVKFLGRHISEMQSALVARGSDLSTKEERYFLSEVSKVVAHILDEDPARSVDKARVAVEEIKALYGRTPPLREDDNVVLSNPFAYLNANDFPTDQYTNLLFSDRFPWLQSLVSPEVQPILICGPRGSGKTIILKSMRLITRLQRQRRAGRLETLDEVKVRLQADRLAAFFVSARIDIGNHCPLTKLPRWASSEEQIHLYFNLLLTHEVVASLLEGVQRQLIDVSADAERNIAGHISVALGESPCVSFAGLIAMVSKIQGQIVNSLHSGAVNPAMIGPAFLTQFCSLVRREIPFFASKNIVFLLDDFSLPRVPEPIQKALLPIIWNSGGGYSFRVTAHSDSMVTQDVRGNTYVRNRDFAESNLGWSYIKNVERSLVKIRQSVDDILRRRFELTPHQQARGLEQLLGKHDDPGEPIAAKIRQFSQQNKLHSLRYAGWRTVIKLCSGDISYILDILRRIVEQSAEGYPVGREIQHREIRKYARSELYRLQDYSVPSCNLYAVANNFGKFSLFKLLRSEVGKKGKRPAEYLRIEVEIDSLSEEAKEALADLLRNAVFIDGGFSSPGGGTLARRLIFKKLFTPVFPTTFNSRDTLPMSGRNFSSFIAHPEAYLKEKMGEDRVPPEQQQPLLDRLILPEPE